MKMAPDVGRERLSHQFVVLIHVFFLQGVKVAATEEGKSQLQETERTSLHVCARGMQSKHVAADSLFMLNKIRVLFNHD